jgi:hypothetical protein
MANIPMTINSSIRVKEDACLPMGMADVPRCPDVSGCCGVTMSSSMRVKDLWLGMGKIQKSKCKMTR